MKVPYSKRTLSAPLGPTDDLQRDFGGFHAGDGGAAWERPATVDDVARLLRTARAESRAVRFRGHGHSMNGSSLPSTSDEIVVCSEALCTYRFDTADTITVGAGALMWDIHTMLQERGYQLLVANDGAAPAPSVGGYISAGGIGENTNLFGGFWETVREMTVVTGSGEVLTLAPGDELFAWMFGSMGQLAFVVEATLAIYTQDTERFPYPMGDHGVIARSHVEWDKYSWFTLFVPFKKAEGAMAQLVALCERHLHCWKPLSNYVYPVRFYTFNPPLLYPTQRGFVAEGIWGTPADGVAFDFDAMKLLEREFMALTQSDPEYRRYIQTEMTFGETDWSAYFGDDVFETFRRLKHRFDPGGILGAGAVF